jgi:hypothetical protein
MVSETNTRRLLNLLLEGQLRPFVKARREQGLPWRIIARDVFDATGVDVTAETLRVWFGDSDAEASERPA